MNKGQIFTAVVFILVTLGVYVHHLFILIPFLLGLMVYGFAALMDWVKGRKEEADE